MSARRRRPEPAIERDLRRELGKAPTEQLELGAVLAPPAAPVSALEQFVARGQAAQAAVDALTKFAPEPLCVVCKRRGYHLKSCRFYGRSA